MNRIHEFLQGATKLITSVERLIKEYNLFHLVYPDHLCYKCGSAEEFESIRSLFEDANAELYQKPLSGRRVATIELPQPVWTELGEIKWLELSDQKPDRSQRSRFDHIEVYVPGIDYDAFVGMFRARGAPLELHNKEHHKTWDVLLDDGYRLRLCEGRLAHKIGRELLEKK